MKRPTSSCNCELCGGPLENKNQLYCNLCDSYVELKEREEEEMEMCPEELRDKILSDLNGKLEEPVVHTGFHYVPIGSQSYMISLNPGRCPLYEPEREMGREDYKNIVKVATEALHQPPEGCDEGLVSVYTFWSSFMDQITDRPPAMLDRYSFSLLKDILLHIARVFTDDSKLEKLGRRAYAVVQFLLDSYEEVETWLELKEKN